MIGPGKSTTEHARALRAEGCGALFVVCGLVGIYLGFAWIAFAVAACGALLVGWTAASYGKGRSSIKAAEASPTPIHHHSAGQRRI